MKAEDIKYIMSTRNGRAVMSRMLSFCGIYDSIGGSHEEILLQEGKRRVGLQILAIISDHCEDQLFEMMKESKISLKESYNERQELDRAKQRNHSEGTEFDYATHFNVEGRHESEPNSIFI